MLKVTDHFNLIGTGLVVVGEGGGTYQQIHNKVIKITRPDGSDIHSLALLQITKRLAINFPGLTKDDVPIGSVIEW